MSVEEYTNAFTDKREFALHLMSDELTKINWYSKGPPWEYIVPVKQAPTFEATIWASRSVESMIKAIDADKIEVGEKGIVKDSQSPIRIIKSRSQGIGSLEAARKSVVTIAKGSTLRNALKSDMFQMWEDWSLC